MKIALHGYGKMGKAVEQAAQSGGHEIVARFNHANPLRENALKGAQVLIDFSNAELVQNVIEAGCRTRTNLVIGTTGWNDRLDTVRGFCSRHPIGVVYAANFSPGANIVFRIARVAGALFATVPQYAAGIHERHHSAKKDVPSGTALRIASEVRQASSGRFDPPIAALRVGAEFGYHTLLFDSPDDLVEISHRARGRTGFAQGAILAAEKVLGKVGFFSFEEVLFGDDTSNVDW